MKTIRWFAILILILGLAMNGRAQIFQLSTPWGGVMSLSVQDVNGPAGSSGGVNLEFNHLSETIYLDPVGKTIRQVGTISCIQRLQAYSFKKPKQSRGGFQVRQRKCREMSRSIWLPAAAACRLIQAYYLQLGTRPHRRIPLMRSF